MRKNVTISKGERQRLTRYLTRYYNAQRRSAIMRQRMESLRKEMRRAEYEDIREQLAAQTEKEAGALAELTALLGCLPQDSREREIMELRHLDFKSWTEIAQIEHYSRTACNWYYNSGLEMLSRCEEAQKMTKKVKE